MVVPQQATLQPYQDRVRQEWWSAFVFFSLKLIMYDVFIQWTKVHQNIITACSNCSSKQLIFFSIDEWTRSERVHVEKHAVYNFRVLSTGGFQIKTWLVPGQRAGLRIGRCLLLRRVRPGKSVDRDGFEVSRKLWRKCQVFEPNAKRSKMQKVYDDRRGPKEAVFLGMWYEQSWSFIQTSF